LNVGFLEANQAASGQLRSLASRNRWHHCGHSLEVLKGKMVIQWGPFS
jgi:hypothetical protein